MGIDVTISSAQCHPPLLGLCQIDKGLCPTVINWNNPFLFLGMFVGVFFFIFIQILIENSASKHWRT